MLAQALADPRVVVGGDHLQPGRRLRGVAADVAVAVERRSGRRACWSTVSDVLTADAVGEAAGVGVGVEGDHPIAAVGGERVAEHQRGGGLAGPTLAAEHHDAS